MEFQSYSKMKKLYRFAEDVRQKRVYDFSLLDSVPEFKALSDSYREQLLQGVIDRVSCITDCDCIVFDSGMIHVYADLDFTLTRVEGEVKTLYWMYQLTGLRVSVYDIRKGMHAYPEKTYEVGKYWHTPGKPLGCRFLHEHAG